MKVTVMLVLMATAISMVVGGSLYDAKEDAKNFIIKKYKEAEDLTTKIKNDISNEKNKREENSESQANDTLEKKTEDAKEELEKGVKESVRTAIAKGKPIQAIDCIETTNAEGQKMISDSKINLKTAIDNVLQNKQKKLVILEQQTKLISDALPDLKNQNLMKLDESKVVFETVKADASKKVEAAKKQLQEIENRINKPPLSDDYTIVRKQIENRYKEISDILLKKLQKCVA